MTQQKLAEHAGVSLPTIQNIERGIGNPSLNILNQIAQALGLSLYLKPTPINWDALSALGIPVSSKSKMPVKRSSINLLIKLREALSVSQGLTPDRKVEALSATFLALKTHWPSIYAQLGSLQKSADDLIKKQDLNRLIKLRALVISNLAEYL